MLKRIPLQRVIGVKYGNKPNIFSVGVSSLVQEHQKDLQHNGFLFSAHIQRFHLRFNIPNYFKPYLQPEKVHMVLVLQSCSPEPHSYRKMCCFGTSFLVLHLSFNKRCTFYYLFFFLTVTEMVKIFLADTLVLKHSLQHLQISQ